MICGLGLTSPVLGEALGITELAQLCGAAEMLWCVRRPVSPKRKQKLKEMN